MVNLIILTAAHQCHFGPVLVLQLHASASHVWHDGLQEETTTLAPCNVRKIL